MIFKIKKGTHRAKPLRFGLFYNRKEIRRSVVFHEDCRYIGLGQDQLDTNKLFGIGYFFNHHIDSARFGWRFDETVDKIIISTYCYVAGKRIINEIAAVDIGQRVELILSIRPKGTHFIQAFADYFFEINADASPLGAPPATAKYRETFTHKKKFAFPLGLYFGGNLTAPHDMSVEIKKL
jgi:hypothetical protein